MCGKSTPEERGRGGVAWQTLGAGMVMGGGGGNDAEDGNDGGERGGLRCHPSPESPARVPPGPPSTSARKDGMAPTSQNGGRRGGGGDEG